MIFPAQKRWQIEFCITANSMRNYNYCIGTGLHELKFELNWHSLARLKKEKKYKKLNELATSSFLSIEFLLAEYSNVQSVEYILTH